MIHACMQDTCMHDRCMHDRYLMDVHMDKGSDQGWNPGLEVCLFRSHSLYSLKLQLIPTPTI